jgi:phosphoglycerate dehydrogenase-like enzyme
LTSSKVGPLRNNKADHGTWEKNRRQEIEFSNHDPTVLVIGAGHCGLEIAARLKYTGVPTLIVDKKPRVGDNVRHVSISVSNRKLNDDFVVERPLRGSMSP